MIRLWKGQGWKQGGQFAGSQTIQKRDDGDLNQGGNPWTGSMIGRVQVDGSWGNIYIQDRTRDIGSKWFWSSPPIRFFCLWQLASVNSSPILPSYLFTSHCGLSRWLSTSVPKADHALSQGWWHGHSWINCLSLVSCGVRRGGWFR